MISITIVCLDLELIYLKIKIQVYPTTKWISQYNKVDFTDSAEVKLTGISNLKRFFENQSVIIIHECKVLRLVLKKVE